MTALDSTRIDGPSAGPPAVRGPTPGPPAEAHAPGGPRWIELPPPATPEARSYLKQVAVDVAAVRGLSGPLLEPGALQDDPWALLRAEADRLLQAGDRPGALQLYLQAFDGFAGRAASLGEGGVPHALEDRAAWARQALEIHEQLAALDPAAARDLEPRLGAFAHLARQYDPAWQARMEQQRQRDLQHHEELRQRYRDPGAVGLDPRLDGEFFRNPDLWGEESAAALDRYFSEPGALTRDDHHQAAREFLARRLAVPGGRAHLTAHLAAGTRLQGKTLSLPGASVRLEGLEGRVQGVETEPGRIRLTLDGRTLELEGEGWTLQPADEGQGFLLQRGEVRTRLVLGEGARATLREDGGLLLKGKAEARRGSLAFRGDLDARPQSDGAWRVEGRGTVDTPAGTLDLDGEAHLQADRLEATGGEWRRGDGTRIRGPFRAHLENGRLRRVHLEGGPSSLEMPGASVRPAGGRPLDVLLGEGVPGDDSVVLGVGEARGRGHFDLEIGDVRARARGGEVEVDASEGRHHLQARGAVEVEAGSREAGTLLAWRGAAGSRLEVRNLDGTDRVVVDGGDGPSTLRRSLLVDGRPVEASLTVRREDVGDGSRTAVESDIADLARAMEGRPGVVSTGGLEVRDGSGSLLWRADRDGMLVSRDGGEVDTVDFDPLHGRDFPGVQKAPDPATERRARAWADLARDLRRSGESLPEEKVRQWARAAGVEDRDLASFLDFLQDAEGWGGAYGGIDTTSPDARAYVDFAARAAACGGDRAAFADLLARVAEANVGDEADDFQGRSFDDLADLARLSNADRQDLKALVGLDRREKVDLTRPEVVEALRRDRDQARDRERADSRPGRRAALRQVEQGYDSSIAALEKALAGAPPEQQEALARRLRDLQGRKALADLDVRFSDGELSVAQANGRLARFRQEHPGLGSEADLLEARVHLSTGGLQGAVVLLDRVEARDPDSPEAQRARGLRALIERGAAGGVHQRLEAAEQVVADAMRGRGSLGRFLNLYDISESAFYTLYGEDAAQGNLSRLGGEISRLKSGLHFADQLIGEGRFRDFRDLHRQLAGEDGARLFRELADKHGEGRAEDLRLAFGSPEEPPAGPRRDLWLLANGRLDRLGEGAPLELGEEHGQLSGGRRLLADLALDMPSLVVMIGSAGFSGAGTTFRLVRGAQATGTPVLAWALGPTLRAGGTLLTRLPGVGRAAEFGGQVLDRAGRINRLTSFSREVREAQRALDAARAVQYGTEAERLAAVGKAEAALRQAMARSSLATKMEEAVVRRLERPAPAPPGTALADEAGALLRHDPEALRLHRLGLDEACKHRIRPAVVDGRKVYTWQATGQVVTEAELHALRAGFLTEQEQGVLFAAKASRYVSGEDLAQAVRGFDRLDAQVAGRLDLLLESSLVKETDKRKILLKWLKDPGAAGLQAQVDHAADLVAQGHRVALEYQGVRYDWDLVDVTAGRVYQVKKVESYSKLEKNVHKAMEQVESGEVWGERVIRLDLRGNDPIKGDPEGFLGWLQGEVKKTRGADFMRGQPVDRAWFETLSRDEQADLSRRFVEARLENAVKSFPGQGARTVDRFEVVTGHGKFSVDPKAPIRPRGPVPRPLQADYLGENLPHNPRFYTVRYLDARERQALRLTLKDGRLHDALGRPFDTRGASSLHSPTTPRAIFVMDEQGELYASTHVPWRFHHSSFLEGGPVAMAGEIEVENGVLKVVTNQSGHYRPTEEQLRRCVERLREMGLDVSQVKIEPVRGAR